MSSHSDDSSGGYSENETFQGPTSFAASHACGISSDKMFSHLGITPTIAPAYDGTTSWFEYLQLIGDWCDMTMLDEAKRGPSLKTRLSGLATVQKEVLDRDRFCCAPGYT